MNDLNETLAGFEQNPSPPDYVAMREQYADLCGYNALPSELTTLRQKWLTEFDDLYNRPYTALVDVNNEKHQLYIGTTCAELKRSENDPLRVIGNFVVTVRKDPPGFFCHNMTMPIEGFHHPHVTKEGIMCITNRPDILAWIADGKILKAVDMIWLALNTSNGSPYCAADKWPVKTKEV